MEIVTIRLPFWIIKKLDEYVEIGLYPNRSEIIREAIRKLIREIEKANGRTMKDANGKEIVI